MMNQDVNQMGLSLRTEKILELQEELLNARKQITNKQASWDKERNQFLSQQEILNMEVIELKQRLSNLSQINEALMQALSNNQVTEQTMNGIKSLAQSIANEEPPRSCKKDSGRQQTQVQKLKEAISEKNSEIKILNKKISDLEENAKQDSREIGKLRKQVCQLSSKLHGKQDEILCYYKQNSELANREHEMSQKIEELQNLLRKNQKNHPGYRKTTKLQNFQDPFEGSKPYDQKNSSYLLLKPTSDQNSNNTSYFHQLEMEDYEDDDEEEKLLCEVCDRVYNVIDFQNHLSECRSHIKPLKKQQRKIQGKLQAYRMQQQKENKRYYLKKKQQFQPILDYSQSNADKISEIQRIMKEYNRKPQNYKPKMENSYAKFSIKHFNYD